MSGLDAACVMDRMCRSQSAGPPLGGGGFLWSMSLKGHRDAMLYPGVTQQFLCDRARIRSQVL